MKRLLTLIFIVTTLVGYSQIQVGTNFEIVAPIPIDTRITVEDLTERNSLTYKYEGMMVYVESTELTYQLVGGTTNSDWVVLGQSEDFLYRHGGSLMNYNFSTPDTIGEDYVIDGSSQSGYYHGLVVAGSDITEDFPIGTHIAIRDVLDTILGYRTVSGNYYGSGQSQIYYFGEITGTINNFIKVDGFNYTPVSPYQVATKKYVDDNISDSTYWVKLGNYLYPKAYASDSVGIGTNSPDAILDVAGRIEISGMGNSVMIGGSAGVNDDLTNNYNTYIGTWSGYGNTDGYQNVGIGAYSLYGNTTENYNTAIGYKSLRTHTYSKWNTAIGWESGGNLIGAGNIAIGLQALEDAGETGDSTLYNIAIGNNTLADLAQGDTNIAIGVRAGRYEESGYSVVNDISAANIYIGAETRTQGTGGHREEIVLGHKAVGNGDYTGTFGNANTTDIYMGQNGQAEVNSGSIRLANKTVSADSILTAISSPGSDSALVTEKAIVDYVSTMGGGTVTSVSSATTNQLTVANGTTTPTLSIVTGYVSDGESGLTTGNYVYDYIDSIPEYKGYVSTTDSPDGDDVPGDYYIASETGTYTNFDAIVISNKHQLIINSGVGTWGVVSVSGTFETNVIPYSGARTDVDLGSYDISVNELSLNTGATVDNIETVLTDDDTHIPTSGAVKDAILEPAYSNLYVSSGSGLSIAIINTWYKATGWSIGEDRNVTSSTSDLTIDTDFDGMYYISFNGSASFSTSTAEVRASLFINNVEQTNGLQCSQYIDHTGNKNYSFSGIMNLSSSNVLDVRIRSDQTGTFTNAYGSFKIHRIGEYVGSP